MADSIALKSGKASEHQFEHVIDPKRMPGHGFAEA